MSHADPEQLAGLALDPTDGPVDVREHVETCPECAGLVAAFTGVRRRAGADALVPPPAELRAKVMAEVRSGAAPPVSLPARAEQADDTFTIRVSASELGDEPGVREVWLINVDGERMISIGLLASGDEGEFAVPMDLIGEGYRIVDISVEPDDGDPTHSGVSIARGELA